MEAKHWPAPADPQSPGGGDGLGCRGLAAGGWTSLGAVVHKAAAKCIVLVDGRHQELRGQCRAGGSSDRQEQ